MIQWEMYKTKTFTGVWEEVNDFVYDYNNIGVPKIVSVENVSTLYYLLYARFGNSPISNMDVTQFKFKVFTIIWQYGPAWEKRLDLQSKLRTLTDDELREGALNIYNKAFNPETTPSTTSEEILDYINEQNTSRLKKSKVGAYMELWEALSTDVTEQFLNRFAVCFKQFVGPEHPFLYVTDEEEDN